MERSEIKPMVDQIECHPGFFQSETIACCEKYNVLVEAYSPMAHGLVLVIR
jgi:diketogulonate reductase-like aldo/keto reductase